MVNGIEYGYYTSFQKAVYEAGIHTLCLDIPHKSIVHHLPSCFLAWADGRCGRTFSSSLI